MKLSDLLKNLDYSLLVGNLDAKINDIKYDSREVEENDVFVALPGYFVDGHDFIPEAILKKASVIIISKMVVIHGDVTVVKVNDTRHALAILSKNYFGEPTNNLTVIGVTGTTGKTTTSHIIWKMLLEANIPSGLIGSIGAKFNNQELHTDNTTPESYEIEKFFKEMLDTGITHVVMEASSQAFKMHRLDGITFDIGVLTNITSDHIGPLEHLDHDEYVACKRELFLHSKKVVINNDSMYLDKVLEGVTSPIISYGIQSKSDLNVKHIMLKNDSDFIGTEFQTEGLIEATFKVSLPGEFNVYNSVCALLVGYLLEVPIDVMKKVLVDIRVRGRMETVLVAPTYKVIIDYAHTEDGMEQLVKTLKKYEPKRLVSIFGSGGNRPRERRYDLGRIIGEASDFCIITMDNPRFEEISSINDDIKVGLNKVNAKYIEIDDRKQAILYAINNHQEGDIILLVGKGHEEYQDIKGTKYYFSEHDIINEIKEKL